MKRLSAGRVALAGLAAAVVTSAAPGTWYAHGSYLIMYTTAVALGWWRLRTLRGRARSSFILIMIAETMWLVGDVLYDILESVSVYLCDPVWSGRFASTFS
ncbi:hypothetical protein [Actinoplanes palleronii]|uniref:Uncharacterized protein n=1 Tax=Actinoplanes palleronii TaxID=113570 RepID=A0ABQ4BJ01_9ACTN|nr:hypothetical protein [Actinoplanes palleronii]GIE70658.1 hypothetical protein Apa02nite_067660 [Actinoplanes palleronii]